MIIIFGFVVYMVNFQHLLRNFIFLIYFKKPLIIETYNEIRPSGFAHIQTENKLDQLAINSATHYNDEAIERRHARMYVSKDDFFK